MGNGSRLFSLPLTMDGVARLTLLLRSSGLRRPIYSAGTGKDPADLPNVLLRRHLSRSIPTLTHKCALLRKNKAHAQGYCFAVFKRIRAFGRVL
ncbi:hypothetical protein ACUXPM_004934 [Ralstonia sp. 151470066-2]|jgi:hypothetical protein